MTTINTPYWMGAPRCALLLVSSLVALGSACATGDEIEEPLATSSTSAADGAVDADSLGSSGHRGGTTDAPADSSDGSTTVGGNGDTAGSGSSSGGAGDTGTNDTSGTGDGVVGELPFGGYVAWSYNAQTFGGGFELWARAELFELEDPESQLSVLTQPVDEPRTEDLWEVPIGFPDDGTVLGKGEMSVPYDVGPQIWLRGTSIETILVGDGAGFWDATPMDGLTDYEGGAWSLEIPGMGAFPAAQLDDVLPGGYTVGDVGFEVVGNNPVTGLTWEPLPGAQEVLVFVVGGAAFDVLCAGYLVNDGQADLPQICAGPSGDWYLFPALAFRSDVEYDGRRLRMDFSLTAAFFRTIP